MTLKPPTKTFPKLVMKEWPEKAGLERLYTLSDDEVIVAHPKHHPVIFNFTTMTAKALSDFTRVLEGVQGQKEAPLTKGDHE